jgi:hypothetical protein
MSEPTPAERANQAWVDSASHRRAAWYNSDLANSLFANQLSQNVNKRPETEDSVPLYLPQFEEIGVSSSGLAAYIYDAMNTSVTSFNPRIALHPSPTRVTLDMMKDNRSDDPSERASYREAALFQSTYTQELLNRGLEKFKETFLDAARESLIIPSSCLVVSPMRNANDSKRAVRDAYTGIDVISVPCYRAIFDTNVRCTEDASFFGYVSFVSVTAAKNAYPNATFPVPRTIGKLTGYEIIYYYNRDLDLEVHCLTGTPQVELYSGKLRLRDEDDAPLLPYIQFGFSRASRANATEYVSPIIRYMQEIVAHYHLGLTLDYITKDGKPHTVISADPKFGAADLNEIMSTIALESANSLIKFPLPLKVEQIDTGQMFNVYFERQLAIESKVKSELGLIDNVNGEPTKATATEIQAQKQYRNTRIGGYHQQLDALAQSFALLLRSALAYKFNGKSNFTFVRPNQDPIEFWVSNFTAGDLVSAFVESPDPSIGRTKANEINLTETNFKRRCAEYLAASDIEAELMFDGLVAEAAALGRTDAKQQLISARSKAKVLAEKEAKDKAANPPPVESAPAPTAAPPMM